MEINHYRWRKKMNLNSLYKTFEDDFYIGAAVSPNVLKTQGKFIAQHFNSITAENQMKFEELQPHRGQFKFEVADSMVEFAKARHMKMRGHTLIWHQQTPDWVFTNPDGSEVSREELLNTMEEHIKAVVSRYKESIYCWDVVNEAIDDSQGYLRNSKWLKIIGEDYIQSAFEMAHRYVPDAVLFYNDYNAIVPEKRDRIYRLLKHLVDHKVPIHGMGIQGHWNIYEPCEDDIKRAIELYGSLGLQVQITELDMSMYEFKEGPRGLMTPTKEMLKLQEQRYESIFRIFEAYKEVITGITFWGVADDYTWLDDFPIVNRKNWPFLFDVNHEPKDSYYKVVGIK